MFQISPYAKYRPDMDMSENYVLINRFLSFPVMSLNVFEVGRSSVKYYVKEKGYI